MIYDVNSHLFRTFLAAGGSGGKNTAASKDNRRAPNEKAKDNKPPLME